MKHFRSIDEAGADGIARLLDLADHMAKKFTAQFERGTVTFRPASLAVDLAAEDGQRFSTDVLQSDRES